MSNMLTAKSCLIFFAFFFSACSRESNELSPAYLNLAQKLKGDKFVDFTGKPALNQGEPSEIKARRAKRQAYFSNSLHDLKKRLNFKSSDSDVDFAFGLEHVLSAMQTAIRIKSPVYADSITDVIFFMALQDFDGRAFANFKDATSRDFLDAYRKYVYDAVKNFDYDIDNNGALIMALSLQLQESSSYNLSDAGSRAFAHLQSLVLGRKFNVSLSEKQKLLRDGNSLAFINSLSEEQAALFREFKKYSAMLD